MFHPKWGTVAASWSTIDNYGFFNNTTRLADLNKNEVRDIALREGLITAGKKDSVGICFVGERNLRDFLKRFISFKKINMFKKFSLNIVDNSCLFTYCSMEQLGKDFKNFLNSSIKLNFKLYIHIEPINELSTKDKFGILSSKYIKKRNYLYFFRRFQK